MATTPTSPRPARKNTALWWILGILGAGIIALVLAGLVFTSYLLRRVHISENQQRVKIETPVGQLRVEKNEGHATGLPVYPNASARQSRGANVELSVNDEGGVAIADEHYRTADPLEKVGEWYRDRLGPEFRLEKKGGWVGIHGRKGIHVEEHDLVFVDDRHDTTRIVALKRVSDGTQIDLVRVGEQGVQ